MFRVLPHFRRLARNPAGSVAIQFALAAVPILGLSGVGLDYTRASAIRAQLQTSLDAAVLAGVRRGDDPSWESVATDMFASAAPKKFATVKPTFDQDVDGNVTGTVAVAVPTVLLGIVGIESVPVSVDAAASARDLAEGSCILTLDHGSSLSNDSIVLNGAPNVSLNQCVLRSNTSLRCNGHDGHTVASIAAGSASGCANSESGADPVPDIYAALKANISQKCSGAFPGVTWAVGTIPATVVGVAKTGYTEYHVCGTLTLAGSGALTGISPATDSVIVIENGGIVVADKANITTKRVTFVLTGNNTVASSVSFPNGKGKAATLALSPSVSVSNPWRGVSLYQDPALTNGVDNDWGPAATFNADGVVYLPNSNVVMRGSGASNLDGCSKIVANSFRTNGSVNLNYSQSVAACEALGVKQWAETEPFISL